MTLTERRASPTGAAGIDAVAAAGSAAVCGRCGTPTLAARPMVLTGARADGHGVSLCAGCSQRARRAAYFRAYYASHKARILDKNRQWARDNKDKIGQIRRARRQSRPPQSESLHRCLDCDAAVLRAERCRRCSIRHRYAMDASYRARRLETTRRWLQRRRGALAHLRIDQPSAALAVLC